MNFKRILVICAGNICRSPMAHLLLVNKFPDLEISSAGLVALVDHPADEKAVLCLQRVGLDLTKHRAKQISEADVKNVDLVLTMSHHQQKHLESLMPFAKGKIYRLGHWQNKDISDPYNKSQEAFDQAFSLIQTFIEDWDKFLRRNS